MVQVPFDECAWCTQAAAPAFLSRSGLDVDDRGFLRTNLKLQCLQNDIPQRVYAAGDCSTVDGHPRPKAGVFAVMAGMALYHSASRGAAVPSRRRRDSCPSDEIVGGFFFDFEAIRTASRPRRPAQEVDGEDGKFEAYMKQFNFQRYVLKLRAKADTWNEQTRVKVSIADVKPCDYKAESAALVQALA